jgi:hypothetical protein
MASVGAEKRGAETPTQRQPASMAAFNQGVCRSKICLESVFIGSVLRRATIALIASPMTCAGDFTKGVLGPRAGGQWNDGIPD